MITKIRCYVKDQYRLAKFVHDSRGLSTFNELEKTLDKMTESLSSNEEALLFKKMIELFSKDKENGVIALDEIVYDDVEKEEFYWVKNQIPKEIK